MSKSFVDGFCLLLGNKLESDQIRVVKEQLEIYALGYDIQPIKTEIVTTEYKLPQEYYLFLATKQQDGKMSAKSLEQYKLCLTKMLYDICLPLSSITVNHLRLHIHRISTNKRTGKPLAQTTLDQRKSIIRSFFQWLYEEEYIEKDPSIRIKPVRPDSRPREAYEDVQIESLRDACTTDRDRAIVDVLTSSGIRVAECAGLKISDVDLDKREIKVFGKGAKHRTAYIDARAVVSIRRYLDGRSDTNEALFVSLRHPHDRVTTNCIRTMLHNLKPEMQTGNVIPHRFRHTMATNAITNGMPIESIQMLLGHSSISTTMRYAHVSMDKVKRDHATYIR